MIQNKNKYLTTKNILFAYVFFFLVVFLLPAGGIYTRENIMDLFAEKGFSIISFLIESILLSIIWSFPFLITKKYKKVTILSIIAVLNYSLIILLLYFDLVNEKIILLINPITLSLTVNVGMRKKYKLLPLCYLIGLIFSTHPLIGNIVILLFSQLFFSEYPIEKQSRTESFFSRLIPYFIIGMGLFWFRLLSIEVKIPYFENSNEYLVIILGISYILVGYFLLHNIIIAYYSTKSWRSLLAYIPIAWIIPLISIFFENKKEQ